MIAQKLARQLGRPDGFIARHVLPRLWNRRNRALNDAVYEALAPRADDAILDIGCGGGYLAARLARTLTQGRMVGVDHSPEVLRFGAERHRKLIARNRLTLRQAEAEQLPFADGEFVKVCSTNAMFYFADPPAAVREMARVLRPGGRLVLMLTHHEDLGKRSFAKHGLRLLTAAEVRAMMEQAGVRVESEIPSADRHRRFVCLVGIK